MLNNIKIIMFTVLVMMIVISTIIIAIFKKDGMIYHDALLRSDLTRKEKKALNISHKMFNIGICLLASTSSGLIFSLVMILFQFLEK